MTRLRELLDVERFYSFLGVSVMIAQHDSYPFNRNNYRIYHDPASRQFVMIAHGSTALSAITTSRYDRQRNTF